jgi:hypothetical protein
VPGPSQVERVNRSPSRAGGTRGTASPSCPIRAARSSRQPSSSSCILKARNACNAVSSRARAESMWPLRGRPGRAHH